MCPYISIEPQFHTAERFSNGLAMVSAGEGEWKSDDPKYGYIDRNGKYIWIPSK
jgi:hypothetical protein